MNILLKLFFFLLCVTEGLGQGTAIEITYENNDYFNVIKEHPEVASYLSKIDSEPMKGVMRSSLYVDKEGSYYKIDSIYVNSVGRNSRRFFTPKIHVYRNSDNRQFEVITDGESNFIYEDNEHENIVWHIDRTRKKEILGVLCSFASGKAGKNVYSIWFTDVFPFKGGPPIASMFSYDNIPGLVLELETGNGFVLTAVDINPREEKSRVIEYIAQSNIERIAKKPPFQLGDELSSYMIRVDDKIATDQWIKLNYKEYFGKILQE